MSAPILPADVRGCSSRQIARAISDAERNLAIVKNKTPDRVQWWEGWIAALNMAQLVHAENESCKNGNGYRG